MPNTMMPRMMSVVVTGRRMKIAAMFMAPPAGAPSVLMATRVPVTSRSWPSVTTVSPALSPSAMTVSLPAARAILMFRSSAV